MYKTAGRKYNHYGAGAFRTVVTNTTINPWDDVSSIEEQWESAKKLKTLYTKYFVQVIRELDFGFLVSFMDVPHVVAYLPKKNANVRILENTSYVDVVVMEKYFDSKKDQVRIKVSMKF